MKIAIPTMFYQITGGLGRSMFEYTKEIANCHDVHVFSCYYDKSMVPDPKIKIHKVPIYNKPLYNEMTFRVFSSIMMKMGNFNIIHLQDPTSFITGDIITVHGCHEAYMEYRKKTENNYRPDLREKLRIWLEKRNYGKRKYKKLAAVSMSIKNELMKFYNIPENDIEVVYFNGVNIEEFRPDKNKRMIIREKLKLDDDDTVILAVLTDPERKGINEILRAMFMLKDRNLKLITTYMPEKYISLARELNIYDNIIQTGFVRNLNRLYCAGDLFMFPTHYEPFGMVALEAMATGLPVIVSKEAGVSEIVSNDKDAIVLENSYDIQELCEKMDILLNSFSLRKKIGINAIKTASNFTWKKTSKKMEKIYHMI